MSRHVVIALLVACESTGGGSGGSGAKVAESGTQKGSAGGFSAQMSAEMAKAGIGGEPITAPTAGSAAATDGSATAAATDGSATAAATDGSAATAAATDGSATTAANGSATTGSAAANAAANAASSAAATATAGGSAPSAGSASAATPASAPAKTATAVGAIKAPENRVRVKPSAEVAAIKLELEPNWERDMGEAGTFSLVVKIPNTDDTRVFMVRYGYEDASAPIDCDQYRKFLEDRGAMKVSLNRQRGAACYVEGTDQGGLVAYRMLLTYGGKRLMCHGSLYKDAASKSLGDLRDKVLLQAKKICETLAL